ncbi:MAG: hypothetical protein ABIO70_34860 [Pseudomonadota bacterium]
MLLISLLLACTPEVATVAPDLGRQATVAPDAHDGLCVSTLLDRGDADRRAAQVAALQALGVRQIRQDLRWSYVQPARDTWDWATEDAVQDAVMEGGFGEIAMLGYGVPWATSQEGADSFTPPDDPADFAAFAAAAAERYSGRDIVWEIWNEPNAGYRFWKVGDPPALSGDPVAYAALFVAAADAIHAVDSGAEVLVGGTFWLPQVIPGTVEFLEAALDAEPRFLEVADGVAIHPYTLYPPHVGPEEEEGAEVALDLMIALTREVTGHLPLVITEMGWPSWGEVSEQDQADFLVREFALAQAEGIRDVCAYTLEDGDSPEDNPEEAFGLVRHGLEELKPSGEAWGALSVHLQAGAWWECYGRAEVALDLPSGVYAVRWASRRDAMTAVWTTEGELEVTLPPLSTEEEPTPVTVTAGPTPVFVPQIGDQLVEG